jgi:signal transduction histidine kinase
MSASILLAQIGEKFVFSYSTDAPNKEDPNQPPVEQVVEFIDYLCLVLDKKDLSLMNPLMDVWLSYNNSSHKMTLANAVTTIFERLYKCAQLELSMEESNQLIADLFPIFAHSNQYIYRHEFKNLVDRMKEEQAALENLDKSKSDFISIAAHELKTPLTLLEGYTSMLREIIEQKMIFDEHIFSLMDGMDSGARRLREIINDMIDASLIDNELLSLSFQPTWLYKLFQKIELEYESAFQSRTMSLEVTRFDGDESANYYDGERIFQAFSNVVSNAIKYTPDGGKIVLDGRMLDDYYEILVIDNGIGVDPKNQAEIFSKLHPIGDISTHSSGKTKFKGGGPGLGLPIAKGIIEAHGGRIWVESDGYDEITCPGSTFHILLPILKRPPEQAAEILFNPQFIHKSTSDN